MTRTERIEAAARALANSGDLCLEGDGGRSAYAALLDALALPPDPAAAIEAAAYGELIVHGARCLWFDTIDKAAKLPSGIPCCPHCRSVLFQIEARHWWAGAEKYEANGHPGYVALLRWAQGKCFPTLEAARAEYEREVAAR